MQHHISGSQPCYLGQIWQARTKDFFNVSAWFLHGCLPCVLYKRKFHPEENFQPKFLKIRFLLNDNADIYRVLSIVTWWMCFNGANVSNDIKFSKDLMKTIKYWQQRSLFPLVGILTGWAFWFVCTVSICKINVAKSVPAIDSIIIWSSGMAGATRTRLNEDQGEHETLEKVAVINAKSTGSAFHLCH